MSLWIKRDVLLPRNRKTYRLAELLAQGAGDLFGGRDELAWRAIAMAILEQIWAHALEHYPSGDLTEAPEAELRDAAAPWLSDTEWLRRDVRELLVKSGHLERTRRDRIVVHDWREWTGAEAIRIHNDRKRKRLERAKLKGTARRKPAGRGAGQKALAEKSREEQRRESQRRDGDPLGSIDGYAVLHTKLDPSHQPPLEGYVRSAQHPTALVATILGMGPDTGPNALAGITWRVIGQALLEMQAASKPFTPALFRAFCQRLTAGPAGAGGAADESPGDRARRRAAELARGMGAS